VSREICHFLILDSKAYNNILSKNNCGIEIFINVIGDYQDRLQFEMLNFFKSTPLTKDWPSSSLVGMMRHSKVYNMAVNNVVYDFGDPSNQIYFIKQGEVEVCYR
jgi:CRP-like cAMP-binding protein